MSWFIWNPLGNQPLELDLIIMGSNKGFSTKAVYFFVDLLLGLELAPLESLRNKFDLHVFHWKYFAINPLQRAFLFIFESFLIIFESPEISLIVSFFNGKSFAIKSLLEKHPRLHLNAHILISSSSCI